MKNKKYTSESSAQTLTEAYFKNLYAMSDDILNTILKIDGRDGRNINSSSLAEICTINKN